MISGFFSDVFNTLKFSIISTIFLGAAIKSLLGNAAIKNIFSSVPKGFIGPRAPVPGIGLAGGLGIAALIAYGLVSTYTNAANAITKSMKDGDSGMGSFIANFLGGDGEGSFFNAMKQGLLVAGTGALAGAALGLKFGVMGGIAAGPPGMIAGALLGFAVGGIIGAIGGSFGSDAIKNMMATLGSAITEVMDSIETFVMDAFESVRKLLTGRLTSRETDPVRLNEELVEANKELKELQNKPNSYANRNDIKKKKKEIEKLEKLLANLTPEMIEEAKRLNAIDMTRNETAGINTAEKNLTIAKESVNKFSTMTLAQRENEPYFETRLAKARKDYASALDNFVKFQLRKQDILADLDIEYKIPEAKNAIKEATDNINGMGRSNAPGGNVTIVNANDNSTKTSVDATSTNNSYNPYNDEIVRKLITLGGGN